MAGDEGESENRSSFYVVSTATCVLKPCASVYQASTSRLKMLYATRQDSIIQVCGKT
jgi:hypothetical protein